MSQELKKTENDPRYYRPGLARSLLHSITKLFSDFPDVKQHYDNNPVKFIERSILDLIDEEEQKQLAKKEYLESLGEKKTG